MNKKRMMMADLPPGADNPLNAAVARRDASVIDMVGEAVKHNQCMLAYQPVMQAHGDQSVVFYEGFIRVLDATDRVIPAGQFMPVVEEQELGRELDCVALEHGLRALHKYHDIRLSINMSARSIGYARWGRVLKRFLTKDETLGERLVLEITESSAMSMPEIVVDFMAQMQTHGIAFALDDFGASTVAIRHFKDFFFDAVKIDGQFIRGAARSHDNQCVIRALTRIAREFDMLTIAESVENIEDADFLMSVGIDCLQGYLFGAPSVRPPWIEQLSARKHA